jgi:hypothetical protein
LPVCHSHCLAVCHPYTICRSVTHTLTHTLSTALPLTCYLSFYTINRSVTHTTCRSVIQTHCSLSSRQANAPSHATLFQLLTRCSHPLFYSLTLYSPHTQLSSAQSDPTGYLTQLHCHTHALGKHNQFTCHTLSLASVQGPLRNSASRIGTEESNLKACHPQARSAHKSLAHTSNSAALDPHPQSFGSKSTNYGKITVV